MNSKRPVAPFIALLAIAGTTLALDRWTKHWVMTHFFLGESRPVTSFFSLTYVHNTGTAFGMLQGNNRLLFVVALVVLVGLLAAARGLCERGGKWALLGIALVIGGAVGNLIDRSTFGRVIDFLDFHFWPVFNIADSAITVGAVSLGLSSFLDGRRSA